jgi:hypothetical protein
MGGFLQSVINGYGGFRILPDRLEFDPVLPPQVKNMNLTSVDYMGSAFDFKINENSIIISMTFTKSSSPKFKVTVYSTGSTRIIKMHQPVLIGRQRSAIFPIGSPRMSKPVNDVKVEYMQHSVNNNAFNQLKPDTQVRPNVPGQVPRPAVPRQGPASPLQPEINQVKKPNLNQQRFDRQNNAQEPLEIHDVDDIGQDPVVDHARPAPGAGAALAPGAGAALHGRGPAYKNLPLSKTDTERDNSDTERKFKDVKARFRPDKLKLPQGFGGKYRGDIGQPGFQERAKYGGDIGQPGFQDRAKIQKGRFNQGLVDTNIERPQSSLQYNKMKKKKAFDYNGKKVNSFKKRLRRQEGRGL